MSKINDTLANKSQNLKYGLPSHIKQSKLSYYTKKNLCKLYQNIFFNKQKQNHSKTYIECNP